MKCFLRVLSIVFVFSLLFTVTACADNPIGNDDTSTTGAAVTTAADSETQETVNHLSAGLERRDFEKKEYVFLQYEPHAALDYACLDAEESNGATINDAVYKRNVTIEEYYNVSLKTWFAPKATTQVRASAASQEKNYHILATDIKNSMTLANEGYLYDLSTLDSINLDNVWYDQNYNEALSIKGHSFSLSGDILHHSDARTYITVFNKTMCKMLGMEYPYKSAEDGKWTLDMLNTYIADVYADNGDGKPGTEDRWGLCSENSAAMYMYIGFNGRVVDKNENGDLTIVTDNPNYVDYMQKALELVGMSSNSIRINDYVSANSGSWEAASQWFAEGGSLFRTCVAETLIRDLRTTDVDFGILPLPKINEEQKQYCSTAQATSGNVISIPLLLDSEMAEDAAYLVEVLSAESVNTLSTAFYDVTLKGKIATDNDSAGMISLIFNNKVYDIGYGLNIAGYTTAITNLAKAGSSNVSSTIQSTKPVLQKSLDMLINNIPE